MKNKKNRWIRYFGAGVVSATLWSGCAQKNKLPQYQDQAKTAEYVNLLDMHKDALIEEVQHAIVKSYQPYLKEALAEQLKMSLQDAQLMSQVIAQSVSQSIANNAAQKNAGKKSSCVFNVLDLNPWVKCVLKESFNDDMGDAQALKDILAKTAKQENAILVDNIGALKALVAQMQDSTLEKMHQLVSSAEHLEKVSERITQGLSDIKSSLEILASRVASRDMPFLSKRFIEGKKFVFTTSLQQGSTGRFRAFNLENYIVKFEVNHNRLVIKRDAQGLYESGTGEDLIVGAYPIVSTRTVNEEDVFYQIDFSQPENKRFLLPQVGGVGDPSLDIVADVVVPRVAHLEKEKNAALNSGLYFTDADKNLVLDQLVLIHGSQDVLDASEDRGLSMLSKDEIRPTLRLSQGFFVIDEDSERFAQKQQVDLVKAWDRFSSVGISDRGQDYPYMIPGAYWAENYGHSRVFSASVRKFNTDKEIAFVLSENTPKSAISAVESAVLSFQRLFDRAANSDEQRVHIRAYTQDAFESQNKTEGLKLGGHVNAADPRVNMIDWDDNMDLGAAWATSVANPMTGEVISADVMMSGHMWARIGCLAYMSRTWSRANDPIEGALVPSTIMRYVWSETCDQALENLDFVKPIPNQRHIKEQSLHGKIDTQAVLQASLSANMEKLAHIASDLLGQRILPEQMAHRLNKNGQSVALAQHQNLNQYQKAMHLKQEDLRKKLNLDKIKVSDLKKSMTDAIALAESKLKKQDIKKILRQFKSNNNVENNKTLHQDQVLASNQQVTLKKGKNQVHAHVDCMKHALDSDMGIFESESGVPGVHSEWIHSPEEAALAMVRAVVIHELGHTFGLRHNFYGSSTTGVLKDPDNASMPLNQRTDSMMDYNDYGIELDAGAMQNYQDPEGASVSADLGLYDVLALSNIYPISKDSFAVKRRTAYCTDGDISTLGQCQAYDYGQNYHQYLLHQANLMLLRLKGTDIFDVLFLSDIANINGVLSYYQSVMQDLSVLFAIAQHEAYLEDRSFGDWLSYKDYVDLAYLGRGGEFQDFLNNFKDKFGVDLQGIQQGADMKASYFNDPFIGPMFAQMIREINAVNVVAVADAVKQMDFDDGMDNGRTNGLFNLSGGDEYMFLNDWLNRLSAKVIVPAQTALPFLYLDFDDGNVYDGAFATIDGQPAQFKLQIPFFNHYDQISMINDFEIDDAINGGKKKVLAATFGDFKLNDFDLYLTALSYLDTGRLQGGSVLKLGFDKMLLQGLNQLYCDSADLNTDRCYELTADARLASDVLLSNTYDEKISFAQKVH